MSWDEAGEIAAEVIERCRGGDGVESMHPLPIRRPSPCGQMAEPECVE